MLKSKRKALFKGGICTNSNCKLEDRKGKCGRRTNAFPAIFLNKYAGEYKKIHIEPKWIGDPIKHGMALVCEYWIPFESTVNYIKDNN